MKKMNIFIISLIAIVFSISLQNGAGVFNLVNANPDYICKKSVSNEPCVISSCGNWNTSGTRVCYGTKTTEVSYYLIRTDCEAGYTKVANGGNVGGSSGRQGSDYVSSTNSCSIVQVDKVSPIGELKLNP